MLKHVHCSAIHNLLVITVFCLYIVCIFKDIRFVILWHSLWEHRDLNVSDNVIDDRV